jgi:hypothetical protein
MKEKHASELGQPNIESNGWTRITQGNGRAYSVNKTKFKGFPGHE